VSVEGDTPTLAMGIIVNARCVEMRKIVNKNCHFSVLDDLIVLLRVPSGAKDDHFVSLKVCEIHERQMRLPIALRC
jgi:hypothetical protein